MTLKATSIVAAMALGLAGFAGQVSAEGGHAPGVSADGAIVLPDLDYRRDWSHLGTWSVAGDDEGAVSFHSVYTQRETVDAFRATGLFPDGAILIKELWEGKTESLTTGEASSPDKPAGWFVMVRDTKDRYPDNALWGDGWGWAFFDPGAPTKTTSTDYESDCVGCHEPVRDTELVYSYAYPSLQGSVGR